MAKTAHKKHVQQEKVFQVKLADPICYRCKKVKSLSLTRALFARFGKKRAVCHNCV